MQETIIGDIMGKREEGTGRFLARNDSPRCRGDVGGAVASRKTPKGRKNSWNRVRTRQDALSCSKRMSREERGEDGISVVICGRNPLSSPGGKRQNKVSGRICFSFGGFIIGQEDPLSWRGKRGTYARREGIIFRFLGTLFIMIAEETGACSWGGL